MTDDSGIRVMPSLLCADALALRDEATRLKNLGFPALHADVIEKEFAPETQLNTEIFVLLRDEGIAPLDVHIMATENERILDRLLGRGICSVCFHAETSLHTDRLLLKIRESGAQSGLALAPATHVSTLGYALERCDYLMLMLINPGYAGSPNEKMVPYAVRKVAETRAWLNANGMAHVAIEVDGRVSLDSVPGLIEAGADRLVVGSSCLFGKEGGLEAACAAINEAVKRGLLKRAGGA